MCSGILHFFAVRRTLRILLPPRAGRIFASVKRGYTLTEMVVVLAVCAVLLAIALPRATYVLDWIAVESAAADVQALHAVAREVAIRRGQRARLTVAADSLRVDLVAPGLATPYLRRAGPRARGVTVLVNNPVLEFGPLGIGRGATNTRIVLSRGAVSVTLTNSRLGRLKKRR